MAGLAGFAGSSSKHGDGFKQHLVEEQSDGFVQQLVPQQEAVVDDTVPLTGDGHTLLVSCQDLSVEAQRLLELAPVQQVGPDYHNCSNVSISHPSCNSWWVSGVVAAPVCRRHQTTVGRGEKIKVNVLTGSDRKCDELTCTSSSDGAKAATCCAAVLCSFTPITHCCPSFALPSHSGFHMN